jgi:FkbM family methyltransferase
LQGTDAREARTTAPDRNGAKPRTGLAKLFHPPKLMDALRVRLFRRAFGRLPIESGHEIAYLGTSYGGWAIPDGVIDGGSVAYCVGAGGDISLELELMDRYGCQVVSFDPAQESEVHALAEANGRSNYRFMCVGVTDHDGAMQMWVADDPEHMALSGANLQRTSHAVDVPVRSLPSVMSELGHERVDLLKLSVEGLEYDLVPKLDLSGMGVKIFALEFSQLVRPKRAAELVALLRSQGYVAVFRNPREQRRTTLTFLREDA